MEKLAVIVLGKQDSGKSTTWKTLFDIQKLQGKAHERKLYFNKTEYVNVFIVNASPDETDETLKRKLGGERPDIILCSVQYGIKGRETIDFLHNNNYAIFCIWLNPGHNDKTNERYFDDFGLLNYLLSYSDAIVGIRSGAKKADVTSRVQEIKDYIYGWTSSREGILQIEK